MNVKQLKELLAQLPDDAPVLVSGADHEYSIADAEITDCGKASRKTFSSRRTFYYAWYPEHVESYEKCVKALVIS